jgi:hypothetical protein
MTRIIFALLLLVSSCAVVNAQTGKWLDTTNDSLWSNQFYFGLGELLLTEDYEVIQTHEICASVMGFYMEKSDLGRFNVNFHGMRTTAQFTFTTQYAAEHWAQKWCTPESLLNITAGRGEFARKY